MRLQANMSTTQPPPAAAVDVACVDIENERPSEIDYINGAVVKLGKQYNVPVPVNETLVTLVHGLQANYLEEERGAHA